MPILSLRKRASTVPTLPSLLIAGEGGVVMLDVVGSLEARIKGEVVELTCVVAIASNFKLITTDSFLEYGSLKSVLENEQNIPVKLPWV